MRLLFRFQEMPDGTICDNTTGDFLTLQEFLKLHQEESMDPDMNPEDLQDQIEQLEVEADNLDDTIHNLRIDLAEQKEKVTSLEDDVADLEEDNKKLTQSLYDYESSETSISQVKATLTVALKEVNDLITEHEAITKEAMS